MSPSIPKLQVDIVVHHAMVSATHPMPYRHHGLLQAMFASSIPEIIELVGSRSKYSGELKREHGKSWIPEITELAAQRNKYGGRYNKDVRRRYPALTPPLHTASCLPTSHDLERADVKFCNAVDEVVFGLFACTRCLSPRCSASSGTPRVPSHTQPVPRPPRPAPLARAPSRSRALTPTPQRRAEPPAAPGGSPRRPDRWSA
ncbi:Calcium-activated potassium channel slowpoke [Papilio machaon]|uniref:Calcium-activated potassium channel slowpoke n=1 Tax=Papilio machaon TaxID=76193 RepID=A0A194QSU6_PAPMA|nr:Calcium-activated potassium channel slowpoke [Papilio machaon]